MRVMNSEQQIVKEFLSMSSHNRLQALLAVLHGMKFNYRLESCYFITDLSSCTNVIVDLQEGAPNEKYILLVAHHDVWGKSKGINDNTVAIATLLMFAKRHRGIHFNKPIKILFTDREETGMIGSSNYAFNHKNEIDSVIVLDIVGYGDALVYGTSTPEVFSYLSKVQIHRLSKILPSDNLTFDSQKIPVALITAAHLSDLKYNKETRTYDLLPSPKFYDSFHERVDDNKLDVINWNLVRRLRMTLYNVLK